MTNQDSTAWAALVYPGVFRKMLVSFLMGFSCGLPLLLTIGLLQAWMKEEGIDLGLIGLVALLGLPYNLKFLWAPAMDRFIPPWLGRRRGWLLPVQLLLGLAIAGLGMSDPARRPWMLVLTGLTVCFFSASQDIVVDAYRREDLTDQELGLGSSLYINGYRLGMLAVSSGGLILADHMPFQSVYLIMAALMGIGMLTTLFTPEPQTPTGRPQTLKAAVFDPFIEYFQRYQALWILAFILLYKIGDQMAQTMTMPFFLDLGFSKTQIGAIAKLFGFWATVVGGLTGGILIFRWGIHKSLWIFGVLQGLSTAGLALIPWLGAHSGALAGAIAFENLTGGMGTAAYAAYMASLTDKRFTATQYALLSSLMGVPRVLGSAPTGFLAQWMGWPTFFLACALMAVPGLGILFILGKKRTYGT